MEMHVVILGNVVDGTQTYGPFKTYDDALRWAETVVDRDWHVVLLQAPD